MDYYLVDYENIKSDGLKNLSGIDKGDTLILFYSENCKNISLDVLDRIVSLKIDYSSFKVSVGTKNALDFQLASYLGYLIGKAGKDAGYHIVSNDKGFEVVADFWKKQNVSVECIPMSNQISKKRETKKKKSKVSDKDLATLNEIKELVGTKNEPEKVLEIFNQYKTKVAINNGLAKYFKDTKKSSEIYKKLKSLLKAKNKT